MYKWQHKSFRILNFSCTPVELKISHLPDYFVNHARYRIPKKKTCFVRILKGMDRPNTSGGPLGNGIAAAEHREVPPGRDETGVGCGSLPSFRVCVLLAELAPFVAASSASCRCYTCIETEAVCCEKREHGQARDNPPPAAEFEMDQSFLFSAAAA